jgi:hypothetical protein
MPLAWVYRSSVDILMILDADLAVHKMPPSTIY